MNLSYRNERNAKIVASLWDKPLDKPDWYKINDSSEDNTDLLIYDVIGWPYNDVKELVTMLSDIKSQTITVKINSPGGDVFDGTALANALLQHPAKIITKVEGLAASMASVIAMAGNEIQAFSNSMMMIHNAWSFTYGNQYELMDMVELLKKIDGNIVDAYHTKANVGKREIIQMMKDTTWLTAKQAKDKGFVDTIIELKAAKAAFDLSIFGNVPDDFIDNKENKLTEREIEKAIRDVYDLSHKEVKAILAGCRKSKDEAESEEDTELLTIAQNTLKKLRGN